MKFIFLIFLGVLFTPIKSESLSDLIEDFNGQNDRMTKILLKICPNIPFKKKNLEWILKMVDASGKIPSGISSGNLYSLGNYDECLKIENSTDEGPFVGKYCANALNINPIVNKTKLLPLPVTIGICIPSTCTFAENYNNSLFYTNNKLCQTKDSFKEFDTSDWVVSTIFGIIFIFIVLQTLYDAYLHYTNRKTIHEFLIVFSILTNGKKLTASNNNPKILHCLNGLRVISMIWIVGGHRFALYRYSPLINSIDAFEWEKSDISFYIHGGHVAVDTFFFMSALLISYGYFQTVHKKQMRLVDIPLFYIHRILRILPAVAALFAANISLTRHLYNGPLWGAFYESDRKYCVKYWWSYFLFIQNYVNYKTMCLLPTWYLSADMQMFILSPFIIIPMGKLIVGGKKKLAYIFVLALTLLSITIPMIIDLFRENDNEFETHARFSIYTLGILFGLILSEYRYKKIKISGAVTLLLWCISLGGMMAIIVTMGDVYTDPDYLKTNLFFTFTRPAWVIGLSWVVFACVTGRGGIVNWILSRPIFESLAKLTFSMYLIHLPLLMLNLSATRVSNFFSEYHSIYAFCGDLIFALIASIVWVLAFESPMVMIEKIIFRRDTKPAENKEVSNQESKKNDPHQNF